MNAVLALRPGNKAMEEGLRLCGEVHPDLLTGFKYIGEQIGFLEAEGHTERYIFGFEESYGYRDQSSGEVRSGGGWMRGGLLLRDVQADHHSELIVLERVK